MKSTGEQLTQSAVATAKARDRAFILWNSAVRGFGCKIYPTGRRSFVLRYRLAGSLKLYEPIIGPYGELTVADARNIARIWAGYVARGKHPPRALPDADAADDAAEPVEPDRTVAVLVQRYLEALRSGA
jgi:hypothetical protein